jgi:2-haloacid dehalogenase
MVARRTGREVSDAGAQRIVGGMQRLPAHPDVPDALDALRAAGYRQVTLTNSPLLVARAQLRHAGLMIMLVAAHAWDVSGALAAGARAAFVARPGMVPSPLGDQPEMVVDDIAALAEELTT